MLRLSLALLTGALIGAFFPESAQSQERLSLLPQGAGAQLIEGACTGCHKTNQITRSSGYTRAGWGN